MTKPSDRQSDTLLTLQQASRMLGAPPSTVRRWADEGKVPVQRTLGGHRRFSRAVLEQLAGSAQGEAAPSAPYPAEWGIDHREMAGQPWHAHSALRQVHGQMRELGQRLLGLLIQFINRQPADPRYLEEARAIGMAYGRMTFAAHFSMHDTVQAFLFFQRSFSHLAMPIPGLAQPTDLGEIADLHARIQHFMDTTLLGTIGGYEECEHNR